MSTERERELPYAWVIVALTFFALALGMGIRSTIGLLVNPWETEFGWDRAAVSLTASFGILVYGLAQPLAGRWADRYGPRLVFTGSLALLGLSTAAVGLIQNLWQAYLVFGIGLMAAVGGTSNVPAAVAIARWVKRRKALAVGIVMAGAAAGQLVLVPAIAAFMKAASWRRAPFTHSLVELAGGLGLPRTLRRHVLYLNPDYIVSRYPDAANGVPFELYDADTARAKINSARQIIRWARGKIRR